MPERYKPRHAARAAPRHYYSSLVAGGLSSVIIAALFLPASSIPGILPPTPAHTVGSVTGAGLRAGAAKVNITPYTKPGDPLSNNDPDWDGTVTPTGIWGEEFTDTNHNGHWDPGEPFTDDPGNTALDPKSRGKYDGIYLAGFGTGRMATGVYDPIWVRAVYMQGADARVAWVSIDTIGYFSNQLDQIRQFLAQSYPGVQVDQIIITATHNHEGPDTVGMWGQNEFTDGKYPKYVRYVNRKIAQAIALAAESARPVKVRWGAVDPSTYPDLAGLQSRNSARTPWFFDEELRVMQLHDAQSGQTVATVVNWSTHVESLEGQNTMISSDFVNTLRTTVEQQFGGVAMYLPGDQGGAEMVGDSATAVWHRDTFDGQTFPVDAATGTPLAYSIDRTYAIGRTVGKAAVYAIQHGEDDPAATGLLLKWQDLYVPLTNQALRILAMLGVLDVPSYLADRWAVGPIFGTDVKTTVYFLQIGEGSFITAPGEMFPEIYWGLAAHHRQDFQETSTGRPFEPAVRSYQPGKYKFFVGYTPDLLGYIVPGYDFYIYGVPGVTGIGLGPLLGEVRDPRAGQAINPQFPGVSYDTHYHETNSASSMLAPAVTCTEIGLFGASTGDEPACRDWQGFKSALLGVHNPFRHCEWPWKHGYVRPE